MEFFEKVINLQFTYTEQGSIYKFTFIYFTYINTPLLDNCFPCWADFVSRAQTIFFSAGSIVSRTETIVSRTQTIVSRTETIVSRAGTIVVRAQTIVT